MSLSSLKGAVGVGIQAVKGTPAVGLTYFPTLNANVMGEQLAQNLPPEVGGSLFSRGAYKAGVRGRGEVAMLPRPDTFGYVLRGLFNAESVGVNGITALNDHVFTVGDTAATPAKWLTVRRYVGNLYGEEISDARIGSLRVEVAAANVVQASVHLLGGSYKQVAGADMGTDDEPVFLTCIADVTEGGAPFIVDRMSVEIGAQLTDNEFRVGSYYLDDITLLQRQVAIHADVRIKADDLYRKVYRNNAVGIGTGVWSPIIYRSAVKLTLKTAELVPQTFTIDLPGVDFLTLPVQMQGADLVRAQLTASVTLGNDNFDPADPSSVTLQPIIVTLSNGHAAVYA